MHLDARNQNVEVDNQEFWDLGEDRPIVCSKPRMMIVIQVHEDGYTSIALGSRRGRGLDGMPDYFRDNYVSVQASCVWRNRDDPRFRWQSKHKPIRTSRMHGKGILKIATVAKLNELVFGEFSYPVAIRGAIEKKGFNELLPLMKSRVFLSSTSAADSRSYVTRESRYARGHWCSEEHLGLELE